VVEREVPVEVEVEKVVEREVPVEVEVEKVVEREVEVEKVVEVEKIVEVEVMAPEGPKETIIFGDLSWDSALIQNRIAQYIVDFGYGYPTETKAGDTLPLFQGLRRGDTHVAMEIWLPNQNAAWDEARAAGEVVSVGTSLGNDWQSAFVIPAYLQEQYPELDNIEDLKDPQYKELFQTAETGDKARLVSCVIGWACEVVNAAQVEGYGLDEHVEVINPGSGALLNADLQGAYDKEEPWLGYQWGTNDPALKLDLVRLEEPAYSDECWFTTKACAYQDATILIAVDPALPTRAPGVTEMLRKWDFNIGIYKSVVRWRGENPDAGVKESALWWLNSNPDIWGGWVSEDAGAAIQAALSAGNTPEGWPDE
jgi:glycine betaine/proline transport system substrate-binding protein